MREALARSDRDFAQAPRRARARAIEIEEIEEGESMRDRVSAFMRTYPLEIAVALLLAAAAGAISGTLVLQTSRHPAPFFARGRADIRPAAAVAARAGPGQSSGSSSDSPSIDRGPSRSRRLPCAAAAPRAILPAT